MKISKYFQKNESDLNHSVLKLMIRYHEESINDNERKFQHTESVLDEYNRQYGNPKLSKPEGTIWRVKNENLKLERFDSHSDKRNEAYKQATENFTKEMAFGSIATSVTQFLERVRKCIYDIRYIIYRISYTDRIVRLTIISKVFF